MLIERVDRHLTKRYVQQIFAEDHFAGEDLTHLFDHAGERVVLFENGRDMGQDQTRDVGVACGACRVEVAAA